MTTTRGSHDRHGPRKHVVSAALPGFRPAWAAIAVCLCVARPAHASPDDSVSVRVEIGASTEVSNEQFYESSIDDTTFLGRQLHSSPESRTTAVAMAELVRGAADGRWLARLAPDLVLGDGVKRIGTAAAVQFRPEGRTRYSLEPRFDYRDETTFGQVRRDWRAGLLGRWRRTSLDDVSTLRAALGTEVVRSLSGSDPFVLSGTSARAGFGYDRSPLFGWNWGLEYGAVARVYRDSTYRDHLEHRVSFTARRDVGIGHLVDVDVEVDRREALNHPENSRDRFLQARARAGASFALATNWSLRPEGGVEVVAYDDPDSLTDFDYAVSGASLDLRHEFGLAWRVSTGPRLEWLTSSWNPAEQYREFAWGVGVEYLTAHNWLSLAPAVGHRAYDEEGSVATDVSLESIPLHTNFDFLELTAFADQLLPGSLRVRALATLRGERHTDRDQDASSLYFSVDVRRLF